MTWRKSCDAQKFFAEFFWRKIPRIGNKRGWHCASDHCVNLSNADLEQILGFFPDDLEQVYDSVTKHKIASEEATPKLIKDWLEQRKVVSQSFCACCLLWKQWSLKNLTVLWDKCGGSCVVDFSYMSKLANISKLIFELSELIYLCCDKFFKRMKEGVWQISETIFMKWSSWV